MNINETLRSFSDNIAIHHDTGEKNTYKELVLHVDELINIINSKQKKLILVFSKNNIETIIGYLICLLSNHVVMLVSNKISNQ